MAARPTSSAPSHRPRPGREATAASRSALVARSCARSSVERSTPRSTIGPARPLRQVQPDGPPGAQGREQGAVGPPRLDPGRSVVQARRGDRQDGPRRGRLDGRRQVAVEAHRSARCASPASPRGPGPVTNCHRAANRFGSAVVQARHLGHRLGLERRADELRIGRVVEPHPGRARQGRAGAEPHDQPQQVRVRGPRPDGGGQRGGHRVADLGAEGLIRRPVGLARAIDADQPPGQGLGRVGSAAGRAGGRRTGPPASP